MAIHCSSNFINGAHSLDLLDVSLSLHAPLARMERASNVDDLLSIVAQEIRTVSGFDRVKVYQFDDDWHGVVLAEEVADGNGATARGRIERYGHAAGGRPLTVVTTLPEPLS